MRIKTKILAAVAFSFSTIALSPAADPAPVAPAAHEGGVVSITLPTIDAPLPEGPGKPTVAAACVICHTARYITTQPKVSRAAWTANVDKMRKVFGAPITDAQAAEAINYLVAIRGTEPAK
jgi:cytochrome c5